MVFKKGGLHEQKNAFMSPGPVTWAELRPGSSPGGRIQRHALFHRNAQL